MRERSQHIRRIIDHRVDGPGDQRRILRLVGELRRPVDRGPARNLVQTRRAEHVHHVARRQRLASPRRSVAVAVAARIEGANRREQAVAEIGNLDRVVPDQGLVLIVEPRSIPAQAEHRRGISPRHSDRCVVGPLIDGLRHFDLVVERERRAPGLLAIPLHGRELGVDVHGLRGFIVHVERRRVAAIAEVERVGERVVDRPVGFGLCGLRRVAARGRRRAGRARHADGRSVGGRERRSLHRPLGIAIERQRVPVADERCRRQVAEVERQRHPVEVEVDARVFIGRVVALIAVADVQRIGVEEVRRADSIQAEARKQAIARITKPLEPRLVAVGRREQPADVDGAGRGRRRSRRLARGRRERLCQAGGRKQKEQRTQHCQSVAHRKSSLAAEQARPLHDFLS